MRARGSILARLDIKDKVMKLVAAEHPDVQKQALLASSKMLVTNWQVVQ